MWVKCLPASKNTTADTRDDCTLQSKQPWMHASYGLVKTRLICYVGKMFTRIGIRIIPVVTSAHPHYTPGRGDGTDINARGCYFPSGPDGHLAPSYAISRLGPRATTSNCGRRHGGYTGWCGSENSCRGIVGEIISPLWLGRVRTQG